MSFDVAGKRVELFKEISPGISRIGLMYDRLVPYSMDREIEEFQAAADRLKLTFGKIEVQGASDIDRAIREAVQNGLEAVIVGQSPMFFIERSRIAQLAIEHRLPTMAAAAEFTAAGVLASYGTKLVTIFGKAPAYVDKVLKGQKPAEIPVEQPTTFELIVNLTTAKAIGFEIPPTILTRADRVIE